MAMLMAATGIITTDLIVFTDLLHDVGFTPYIREGVGTANF